MLIKGKFGRTTTNSIFLSVLILLLLAGTKLASQPEASFSNSSSNSSTSGFRYEPSDSYTGNPEYELNLEYSNSIRSFSEFPTSPIVLLSVGTANTPLSGFGLSLGDGSLFIGTHNELVVPWKGRQLVASMTVGEPHTISYELRGRLLTVTVDGVVALSNAATDSLTPSTIAVPANVSLSSDHDFAVSGDIRPTTPSVFYLSLNWFLIIVLLAYVTILTSQFVRNRLGLTFVPQSRALLIRNIAWVISITTLLAVVGYLSRFSPYQLGPVGVRFSDLSQLSILASGDPYQILMSNYPPFGLLPFRILGRLPDNFLVAAVLTPSLGVVWGVVLATCRSSNRVTGLLPALVIMVNFPLLLAVDRGNTDLVAVAAVLLGFLLYFTEPARKFTSSTLLGLAAAMKVWPLIFVVALSNRRRDWRLIFQVLLVAAGATVLSGFIFNLTPISALAQIVQSGNASFLPMEQRQSWAMSLDSMVLVISDLFPRSGLTAKELDVLLSGQISHALHLTLLFASLVWALLHRSLFKKFLILSCAVLLFTPVSFSYKGLLILIPLTLLIKDGRSLRHPAILGLLIGLVLAPAGLVLVLHETVTIASILHPAALILILLVLLAEDLQTLIRAISIGRFPRLLGFFRSRSLLPLLGLLTVCFAVSTVGLHSTAGWSTWKITPAGSSAPIDRAIVGLAGTEASLSPVSGSLGLSTTEVYFPPVSGQVNCSGAAVLFAPNSVVVKIPQTESMAASTLNFALPGSKLISLRISMQGRAWTLEADGVSQTQYLPASLCINLARADLNVSQIESSVAVTWGRPAGANFIASSVGVLVLLLLTTLTALIRRAIEMRGTGTGNE